MRLGCGMEIFIDSDVDLHRAALEPASATLGQFRWLGNLGHPKQIAKELSCGLFFTSGHGKLEVINGGEWVVGHVEMVSRRIANSRFVAAPGARRSRQHSL